MIKKFRLLIIVNLLFICNLTFSQQDNPYINFNADILKKQKDYAKNFNAGDINTTVLYRCLTDIVDAARAEYAFAQKMKHDIALDSAAQMQADYMGRKDERTLEHDAPYRTTYYRFRKYNLTHNGTELAAKAKAFLGEKEYSYYDVSLELVKSLLKNTKTAQVLLDKQYSYMGLGFACDQYLKSIYVSFTLGNDRTFNLDKAAPGDKNAPYTRTKNGLEYFDSKVCNRCYNDYNFEALSEYISVKNNDILLVCNDARFLKKLIGRDGDAIVLDFVQHFQYDCKNSIIDNDRINHGFITKPIVYQTILNNNTVTDKKANKINAKIGVTPDGLTSDDFDINILIIKEGKYVCRTVLKKSIENKGANNDLKINFIPDKSIKSLGDWLPVAEENTVSFKIPFTNPKKTDYKQADVTENMNNINEPAYKINSFTVIVRNSINLFNDPAQQAAQKKRGQSIAKALNVLYPNIPVTVSYEDSWVDFQKDIVENEQYYYLCFDKTEALQTLKANGNKVAKELDTLLVKECYAEVQMNITYQIEGVNEQAYTVTKFNRALAANQPAVAMAVQNYIIQQVESKKYPSTIANKMNIPFIKTNQPFLNNQLYISSLTIKEYSDSMLLNMQKIYSLNTTNAVTNYNRIVCKITSAKWSALTEINALQADIDRLYAQPALAKETINNLNLEFQAKVLSFLATQPGTPENETMKTNTIAKIKQLTTGQINNWQNAYKLASIFIKERDYPYALSLFEPFLDDETISNDFLFSYISLAAHREADYLSSIFSMAVKSAASKDAARLCGLFDKLPTTVFDNREVKTTVCKTCNK